MWLRAYHLGFIVGWFGVTARSPRGRNPYVLARERAVSPAAHREVSRHRTRAAIERLPVADQAGIGPCRGESKTRPRA